MKKMILLTFFALFALISSKALFTLHSHSGSWCDYWTGLGLVNIQVIQKGVSTSPNVLFNMTLTDDDGTEYFANCTIEQEVLGSDDKEEDLEEEEELKEEEEEKELKEEEEEELKEEEEEKELKEEEEEELKEEEEEELKEEEEEELKEEEEELKEEEEEEEEDDDDIDYSKVKVPRAYCYFTPPKISANLKYKKDTLEFKGKDEIEVEDDYYVIAQKCNTQEEASKIGNLSLSFEQVNSFEQKGEVITFMFYGLTTQTIEINYEIIIEIYLFLEGGVKEKEPRKVKCTPVEAILPPPMAPKRAPFQCKIEGLKEKYKTFNFFTSEFIADVPYDNKILLDPVLTAEAIKNGTIEDVSSDEYKDKVPNLLVIDKIDGTKCKSEGTYTIVAKAGEEITEESKLHIPMTFPDGLESICTVPASKPNESIDIECKFAGETQSLPLIFEQRTVKHGKRQFLMGKAKSDSMTCINGELKSAEKLLDLSLSFRQLNAFKFEQSKGEITFNFFGLTTEKIEKETEITLMVYLLLEGGVREPTLSKAVCNLDKEVNPSKGQAQADFTCKIAGLDKTKVYKSFELSQSDFIVGIPAKKSLLDPVKTAEAIEKKEIIDFSIPKNKEKVPVLFTPDSIDGSTCPEKGEFTITGTVDATIEKKIEFQVPVSYPEDVMSECTLDKAPAGKVEIKCDIGEQVLGKSLMFEQQIIRDEMNEALTLGSIKSKDDLTCAQGNVTIIDDDDTDDVDTDATDTNTDSKGTDSDVLTDKETDSDDDEDKSKVSISFRQIKDFTCSSGTVTVMLFALVTKKCVKGKEVIINVNLIKKGTGEMEEELKEMKCELLSDVEPEKGKSKQGAFKCTQKVEGDYYSLRLNSSETLAGIPTDEVLLDPKLTEEEIKKDKLLDYEKPENQQEDKIPATLDIETVKTVEGKIIIVGVLSKEMKSEKKFVIPLTEPEGVVMKCSVTKNENNKVEITCKSDAEIKDESVVLEQMIIKDGPKEVVNLRGFKSPKITCPNLVLAEAEERMKIPVSFRQVSHLEKKTDGLKFFFAGLLSEKKPKDFKVTMKMVVVVKEVKKEKDAICTLVKDVDPGSDSQVQGDFNCEVALEKTELDEIKLDDTQAVQVSPDNEQITGVSELEEDDKSPKATDNAIAESETKNMTELGECVDYSKEENKKIVPPTFIISTVMKDIKEMCPNKGKFRLKGKFSHKIHDKMSFMLPMTFPLSKVKCKVLKAKPGEEVEVTCKVQKGFKKVKKFVFEERMIKKRHKEMLLVKGFKKDIEECKCENYNTIKLNKVKLKQKAKFSFLKVWDFKPVGKKPEFLLALMRNNKNVKFEPIKIKMKVKVKEISSSNLRRLDDSSDDTIDMTGTCTTEKVLTEAGQLKCSGDTDAPETPLGVKIDPDDNTEISGLNEEADPSESSAGEDLELADKLPTVEIDSVDGSKCEEDGSYIIKGKVTDGELSKNEYKNVEVPFGYPDSSGLCNITVNNKDVTMNCKNKEKFDASSIMFEPTVIEDSEKNKIFKMKEKSIENKFACVVSVDSEVPNGNSTEPDDDDDDGDEGINHPFKKKSNKGLSGGAIAAIVICSIVALSIVGILIALGLRKKPVAPLVNNSSTLNNFAYEQK